MDGSQSQDGKPSLDAVQRKLEDLLSKGSLATDTFLQHSMSAQMYIPLAALSKHTSLSSLGNIDVSILLEAAKRSSQLTVDEACLMVRPVLKAKRNTLILHGLPEGAGEQDLLDLFLKYSGKEALEAVKPDVNRTAFVTFTSDETAQSAALWLRSQTLMGAPIKCSVKTEQVNRGFFPASSPPSPAWDLQQTHCSPQMWSQSWQAYQQQPWTANQEIWHSDEKYYYAGDGYWSQGMYGGTAPLNDESQDAPAAKGGGKGKKGKKGGKGKDKDSPGAWSTPLAQAEQPANEAPDEAFLEDGYSHEYRSYSRQQLIDVCNSMDDIGKPESYVQLEEQFPGCANMFRKTACKDWAPLPTPFLGPRSSPSFSPMDLMEGLAGERPPRKGSNWSRSSMTSEREDESWRDDKGGGKGWRKRTSSGWSDRWEEGETESAEKWGRGSKATWVEKAKAAEPEEHGAGEHKAASQAKAAEPEEHGAGEHKAASQVEAEEANGSALAGIREAEDKPETVPQKTNGEDDGQTVTATPSWADKVRAGKK
eukprot:TRINITY_DN5210_c0_g1_i1.p1 TRINITY_DN5210_c0_g1~~TRINITY_DN5210_c0_g1_i1.p1  ORF type:complete len:536 (+),score=145.30 TRINITY_DN5210_c0_g1_i1:151-1758(+)